MCQSSTRGAPESNRQLPVTLNVVLIEPAARGWFSPGSRGDALQRRASAESAQAAQRDVIHGVQIRVNEGTRIPIG
jgi:hypothetical protein